ncbi:MAG: type II toxin-antitoxin system VapC family toxin [Campylobacterota bacterium]
MNYILDTNIVSAIGENKKLAQKLATLTDDEGVSVSVLSIYEAEYGLKNTNDPIKQKEIQTNINFIKKYFDVISLDLKESKIYSELKVAYKNYTGTNKNSMKKNDIDLLIASSAIAHNEILVSNDKIFATIQKLDNRLQYENWI